MSGISVAVRIPVYAVCKREYFARLVLPDPPVLGDLPYSRWPQSFSATPSGFNSPRFKNRPRFGPHNGALVLTGGRPLRVSQTTLSCAAAFSSASFVTTQAFERTTRMKMDSAF